MRAILLRRLCDNIKKKIADYIKIQKGVTKYPTYANVLDKHRHSIQAHTHQSFILEGSNRYALLLACVCVCVYIICVHT